MIVTSYFGNWRNWPKDLKPLAICRYLPNMSKQIEQELRLAPPDALLKKYKSGEFNQADYEKAYLKLLDGYDPEVVAQVLDGTILICYEKPPAFCHRHIVAKWLTDRTNTVVTEVDFKP